MTRYSLTVLVLAIAGFSCGSDDAVEDDGRPQIEPDANAKGGMQNGAHGEEDAGSSGGSGGTAGARVALTNLSSCDDDDPSTPGSECPAEVACGGTADAPHACPSATHACCAAGFPSEDTVNCYEGASACMAQETQATCDGPEDCGGEACCFTFAPTPKMGCMPVADCDVAGTILCHEDADCPIGKICEPHKNSPWWGYCG